ncbi:MULTISPECIES: 50S ribosomal protein L29 [Helicobacter]|uniref:Large ribosomal subunit protein uL29 n=2 Tax=Helicobacter TaxID=209 RepID=C5ZZ39_9HELI|nr:MULTISPECIES: 50S ribosomal protein L29 [Helicobacter]EES89297.1 50S ribosomal protein L29 [Helicobacter canadensis MIT 98-5491]EFR48083.1 ribosomal protein L29 [Helicobacter canadensis MIT 98-5491]MCI2235782.1 50S ribosomal protein L29 [Helicobacter sp. CaF467b]MCI7047343.1 50S ribosomal protein L29 [Helicobacter sp.]MCI7765189.1 50S ribosomal protein L29 [Helicobacter sp.]
MKYTEINEKSIQELQELLKEKETSLFELNLKLRTMQQTNTSELKATRKDIARIKTAMNAKRRAE